MKNLTPTPRRALDFEPVPRKYRYDGWTAERQRAFIEVLADTGSVKAAALRTNMSPEGAYYLRRQPGAESFNRAWTEALNHGVQRLTDIAIDRAIEGVAVPIHYKGQLVGEKHVYDNHLLQFVLRHHLPDRYGMPGLRPGTRSQETVEREAAEHCPVCKVRTQEELEPNATERKALGAYMNELSERYAAKVRYERRMRLAGNVVAADFTVRQLTMIELQLVTTGSGGAQVCLSVWEHAEERRRDAEDPVNPICALLADLRNDEWAKEAEVPARPRNGTKVIGSGLWSGPTRAAREAAQRRAQDQIAEAQAVWEAAATEAGWAKWCGEGEHESIGE